MANNITTNPMVIDTAGAGVIINVSLRIKKLRWVGGTTAGHAAVVKDKEGNIFWESVCPAANYVEETDFALHKSQRNVLNGLIVSTLGSGKLYLYE